MNSCHHDRQRAFTIVEVMMFLAISGAIAVAILATSGIAISQQRYRDAVTSFQVTIQQQYNETSHVVNSRDGKQACDNEAVIDEGNSYRGTSDCVVLGRYIVLGESGGSAYASGNVIDHLKSGQSEDFSDSDMAALGKYVLTEQPSGDSRSFAWETRVRGIVSIAILRSPVSGSIVTLSSSGTTKKSVGELVKGEIDEGGFTKERVVCLQPNGLISPVTRGIKIGALASGPNSITSLDEGDC